MEGPGVWQTLGKKGRKKTEVWQTLGKKKEKKEVYTYIFIYTYGGTYKHEEKKKEKRLKSGKLWGKKKSLYIYIHIPIWWYRHVCTMGRRPRV